MSENIADGAQTREVAAAPFDKRFGADVLFLTSDNVYFYLHKSILSMASSFFEAMFSLAQIPVSSSSSQLSLSPDDSDLPAIEVTEDSLALDHLLRYCYPVRDPVMADLPSVDRVLSAAIKYALEAVIELAKDSLRRRVEDNPLLAFVIACRHSCEEEACLAAEALKKKRERWSPLKETFSESCAGQCYLPEMENLNAVIYDRLICFCLGTRAGTAKFCHHRSRSEGLGGTSAAGTVVRDPTALYPFNQSSADTVLRSTEGVDFRIHKLLVELQITANPVFPLEGILLTPLDTNHLDGIPVIQTKEPCHVLQLLLQLCYPQTPSTHISSWNVAVCCADDTIDTIAAALRYGMMPIVGLYQARLREVSSEAPMGVYCISISFGWFELAATVASSMALTTTPFVGDLHRSKLDLLTSGEYRRYLEYWHAAQRTILAAAGGSLYSSIFLWNSTRQLSYESKDSDIRVDSPVVEWAVNGAIPTRRPRGPGNFDLQQAITKSKEMDSKIRVGLKSVSSLFFQRSRTQPLVDSFKSFLTSTHTSNYQPDYVMIVGRLPSLFRQYICFFVRGGR